LDNRLLRQLGKERDKDFHRLLLHTELRCLSNRAYLTRFFVENEDISLCADLDESHGRPTGRYLKFNEMNLWLQADNLNARKLVIPFPLSYFVERDFSVVTDLLTKWSALLLF
ncbi:hypothetical protein M514_04239, partial [Trichuris suis]